MKRNAHSFDPLCLELAAHFLPDDATVRAKNDLAQAIQDAVEAHMTKNICPVCGGDMLMDMSQVKALVRQHGLRGEHVDPGGRVLIFEDATLRVSDCCSSCDAKSIQDFLAERAKVLNEVSR